MTVRRVLMAIGGVVSGAAIVYSGQTVAERYDVGVEQMKPLKPEAPDTHAIFLSSLEKAAVAGDCEVRNGTVVDCSKSKSLDQWAQVARVNAFAQDAVETAEAEFEAKEVSASSKAGGIAAGGGALIGAALTAWAIKKIEGREAARATVSQFSVVGKPSPKSNGGAAGTIAQPLLDAPDADSSAPARKSPGKPG